MELSYNSIDTYTMGIYLAYGYKFRPRRSALIHESFSAHQGVEDDDMNLLCLGGRVIGFALALEIVRVYVAASHVKAERFERRLAYEATRKSLAGLGLSLST